MSTTAAAPRFLYIDALRGIAALLVVWSHIDMGNHTRELLDRMPAVPRWIVEHGFVGVAIFFVLSGFVIAHSVERNEVTWRYLGRFMLRRSIRLDPPYWISMV